MSSPTRWAGVPLGDRRTERRALLIAAAFALFGDGGDAAVSVRSVCRECGLNTRYFYESFGDVNELLGATYDQTVLGLNEAVSTAMDSTDGTLLARSRAGTAAVLTFSAADPRRGRLLFTDAPANPVLAERREATQAVLFRLMLDEDQRVHPDADPLSTRVGAALYTGAMTGLIQQWLAGHLGSDVDVVVEHVVRRILGG